MRALLDVNMLVALFDGNHSLHAPAMRWFGEHGDAGWASSPITQLLALAVSHGGCLVTLEPSIPLAAVKRAQKKHLIVL